MERWGVFWGGWGGGGDGVGVLGWGGGGGEGEAGVRWEREMWIYMRGRGAGHESERGGWRREGLRFRRIEGFCTPQNRAEWEMVSLFVHKKAFIYSSCFFFFFFWLCHFPSFPVHSLPSLLLSTASFAHVSPTHTHTQPHQ